MKYLFDEYKQKILLENALPITTAVLNQGTLNANYDGTLMMSVPTVEGWEPLCVLDIDYTGTLSGNQTSKIIISGAKFRYNSSTEAYELIMKIFNAASSNITNVKFTARVLWKTP